MVLLSQLSGPERNLGTLQFPWCFIFLSKVSVRRSVSVQHLGVLFKTDHGKNLMFKDSTEKLVRLPPNTDAFTYLGVKYMRILQSLKRGI